MSELERGVGCHEGGYPDEFLYGTLADAAPDGRQHDLLATNVQAHGVKDVVPSSGATTAAS